MQIIRTGTTFDFVGKRYIAGGVSLLMVLVSWAAFVLIGPNWGIDFTGGTELQGHFVESVADDGTETIAQVSIEEVRKAIGALGLSEDAVQQLGSPEDSSFIIRIQDPTFGVGDIETDLTKHLTDAYGADWIAKTQFDAEVGARFTITYTGTPVAPQDVLQKIDMEGVTVQEGAEDNTLVIRVPGLSTQIEKTIQSAMGDKTFKVDAVDAVGPKVGADLARQGFLAVAATLGLVLLYVAFRFDLSFAPGAILALFHDVSITVGIFVLMQREFNLPMIGALLTIVGYSLNDTIVIYDRIRENMDRFRRAELSECINTSVNETLNRTLNTSITTFLAIVAFLFFGGPVIQSFALAMMFGIIFGTYSTVYVASPMILVMEDLKPALSRLVAAPGSEPEPEPEDGEDPEAGLTEAEKRRRHRARGGAGDS